MIWQSALSMCFLLLCLRFQVAAVRSAGSDLGPVIIIIAAGLGLGAWNPWAGMFAFTVSVPLLMGLSQIGFLDCPSPPSLVFSAMWTGISTQPLLLKSVKHLSPATLW